LWAIVHFARSLPRRRISALAVEKLSTAMFFWLKYFDRYLVTRPEASDGASGTLSMGRRRETAVLDAENVETYRGAIDRPVTLAAA